MSEQNPSEDRVLSPAALRDWPLPVPDGAGKKPRGTVLIVGGSRGTPGAVLLAGLAALRSGAGTLQMAAPESVAVALAIHVPEGLAIGLPETAEGAVSGTAAATIGQMLESAQAVLVGPGLHDAGESRRLTAGVLERLARDSTVVLDAYALHDLSPSITAAAGGRLVLTPNTGEAARLLDRSPDELGDLAEASRAIAKRFDAVVALRGHIAAPAGELWLDQSGDIGLGTSGSGDVLAGVIAGLLARGASPAQAACWGSHLHATAGERLAARIGRLGFLARELLDEVPVVLAEMQA